MKKEKDSEKNFTNDYSFDKDENCEIDMVLSGEYLDNRKLDLDLNNINIDEYPDNNRLDYLKKLIAKKYNKNYENFILGAASNGIIQNLVKLLFAKGGTLLTTEYSFSQPEYAVTRIGGKVKKVKHNQDFTINFDNIIKNIDKNTRAIFLCNPNNPTGYYYDSEILINFAKKVNVPIIVSEAAIEFSKNKSLLEYDLPENIIVTRTFSKAYGLAGLRIGYAFLSGNYLELYIKNITRFEVSILSVEIAIKMLEKISIENNINLVISEREYLQKELKTMGIDTLISFSNAFMSLRMYKNDFFELLKQNGITVAQIDSAFENYYYFRVAVRKHSINKEFINKIKKIGYNNIKIFERR